VGRRYENGLKKNGWEDVDWIYLAQDRGKWRAVVNTVMIRGDSIVCGELLDCLRDFSGFRRTLLHGRSSVVTLKMGLRGGKKKK
jgi:hypothetical protein